MYEILPVWKFFYDCKNNFFLNGVLTTITMKTIITELINDEKGITYFVEIDSLSKIQSFYFFSKIKQFAFIF